MGGKIIRRKLRSEEDIALLAGPGTASLLGRFCHVASSFLHAISHKASNNPLPYGFTPLSIPNDGTGDSIIINCTGLFGFFAQERGIPILADPELKPVRGQILLVEAPSIKVAYGDYSHPEFPLYIYPRKVSFHLLLINQFWVKKKLEKLGGLMFDCLEWLFCLYEPYSWMNHAGDRESSYISTFETLLILFSIPLYLPQTQDCVLLGGTYQPGQTDTTPK